MICLGPIIRRFFFFFFCWERYKIVLNRVYSCNMDTEQCNSSSALCYVNYFFFKEQNPSIMSYHAVNSFIMMVLRHLFALSCENHFGVLK